MFLKPLSLVSISLASGLVVSTLIASPPSWAKDDKKVLRGTATKEGLVLPQGEPFGSPGLSRQDIDKAGDPFSKDPGAADPGMHQALEAPQEGMGDTFKAPPSRGGFGLGADKDDFAGQGMPGVSDDPALGSLRPGEPAEDGNIMQGQPNTSAGAGPGGGNAGNSGANPADPDASREMQLAWDEWHRRVAEEIFNRWNGFALAAFKMSPPVMCRVSYIVTREGQIQDIRFIQKSPNVMFNSLVVQSIKSINGNRALLQFPQGSHRSAVEKKGEFSQNCGNPVNAFRYTTGDRETYRQR